jgi:flagellar biosynthesis component FlhA
MSYNPLKGIDFSSLPNYSITNVPILTYLFIGITTLTLGYVTMQDKESEHSSSSGKEKEEETKKKEETKKEEKGGSKKQNRNKTKRNSKHK